MPRRRYSKPVNYNAPPHIPSVSALPKEDQAEVGPVIHWNDLKPHDFFVLFDPETYEIKFCETTTVERKPNCVIVKRIIHDIYDTSRPKHSSDWKEDVYTIHEGKRKGTWVVHEWNQSLRKTRSIRRVTAKADRILDDLLGVGGRAKVNARRQDEGYQVAHRSLFSDARSALNLALALLGLNFESNLQDLRKAVRTVALNWHPDRKLVFLEGKGTEAEFERESKKYYDALATAQDYIQKKEQLGAMSNG